ncbi:hypothetical protein DRN86_03955 [Candidatus Geothermarchaeota archaeon]|nr:MAG: hypothetical protein DRN86_03955 [Candidatus Geothermarchaeota archaeon]
MMLIEMIFMVKKDFKLPIFLRNPKITGLGVFSKFNPWETCFGFTCHYSLNVYVGCYFSCLYCYARSYISKLHPSFSMPRERTRFRERLRKSLKRISKYLRMPVIISSSTDPYQPLERVKKHTRYVLSLLREYGFPVIVNTKSALITRDVDVLGEMDCVVALTITTLNRKKAIMLEPRAPSPDERLKAVRELAQCGIKTVVRVDPIIPGWNSSSSELDDLLRSLSDSGTCQVITSIVKVRKDFRILLERLYASAPSFREDIIKILMKLKHFNRRKRGYLLASKQISESILMRFKELAKKHNLSYSFCMEDLPFEAETCNGVHNLRCWNVIKDKILRAYEAKLASLRDEYSLKEYVLFQRFIKRKVNLVEVARRFNVIPGNPRGLYLGIP